LAPRTLLRFTGGFASLRYYGPIRLPARRVRLVIFFFQSTPWIDPPACGVSQFPVLSVGTRRPHRPRRAERLHAPVASPFMLASPSSTGSHWRNEADLGSLIATARTFAFRGFVCRIAPAQRPVGYMANGSFHDELLSVHKTKPVSLTHRRARRIPMLFNSIAFSASSASLVYSRAVKNSV
jgi:hypothetical protein